MSTEPMSEPSFPTTVDETVFDALARVPSGRWVMTAAHEERSLGLCVSWVQQCGFSPPCVSVAIPKGEAISPMVRDGHAFALCQVPATSNFIWKAIQHEGDARDHTDTFRALDAYRLNTGSPVLRRSMAVLDCVVVRHIDFDSDHELFVAQIIAGAIHDPEAEPCVRIRENGSAY